MTNIGALTAYLGVDTGGLDKASTALSSFARTATTVLASVGAAFLAKEAILAASRYETMGVVMRVVGENAGYTARQMSGYEQSLKNTGIAAIEARSILTRMSQAQIDLSQTSKLARVAQDAAVIGNVNSSEAFERMTYGIQSAQVEILRTIGINVSFEDSYKKVASQLDKTVAQLTQQEKMQARVNSVLEAGTRITGTYEAAMGTAGKQLLSLQRYHDNLKVAVGSIFQDVLLVGVEAYTGGLKDANAEMERMQKDGSLKKWSEDLVSSLAVSADFVSKLVAEVAMLTGTMVSGMMQTYYVAKAVKQAASLNFSGAGTSFTMAEGIGQAWTDDMKKQLAILSAEEGKFSSAAKKMFAERAGDKSDPFGGDWVNEEINLIRSAAAKSAMARQAALDQAKKDNELAIDLAGKWSKTRISLSDEMALIGLSDLDKELATISFRMRDLAASPGADLAFIEGWAEKMSQAAIAAHNLTEAMVVQDNVTRLYEEEQKRRDDIAKELASFTVNTGVDLDILLDEYAGKNKETAGELSETWQEAHRNMQSFTKDTFSNIIKGEYDSIGDAFSDMLTDMVANWTAAQFQMAMWGTPTASNPIGDGLISAATSWAGGAMQNARIDSALTEAFEFHSGGVVGIGGRAITAPASLWSGAPRLHNGLAADEFPAILQRGETVTPKNQVGRGGNTGGDVTINLYNQGKQQQVDSSKVKFDVRGMVVDIFLQDMSENGPMRRSMGGGI